MSRRSCRDWLRHTAVALLLLALVSGTQAENPPHSGALIAIVVDDLGYRLSDGLRAVRLPGPVAVAVLPHTAHGPLLAREAHRLGKEVMLHLPMQAMANDETPGPGALGLDHTRTEFARVFAADLATVPFAGGVNNHMGSLLTRHPGHMRWLMEELEQRGGLFFIDSYTTPQSVGLLIASEHGVPALRRDVFLDDDAAPAAIAAQWQRLLLLAEQRGFAIGIAHPYPATLALLEGALPALEARGVRLVPLAAVLPKPDRDEP